MIKIYFDNNLIDNESYYSLENSHDLINGNFSLGSTASNTYKISVDSSTITTIPQKVDIYEDETQIASLYVDSTTKEEQQTTINLVDQLTLMNKPYDAKPLIDSTGKGYATLLEIVNDICSKFGLTLGTTNFNGKDKHINYYDNSIYARDYISFVAELNSGYAYVENNVLYFKKHKTTSRTLINKDDCEKFELGEKHVITRVVYDTGTDKWSFGNDNGDTLYLNTSNVYISEESDVQQIYNDINGFIFYSINPEHCPISNVKSGDVITFVDGDTLYPTIANVSRSYFGEWYGKYSLQVNSMLQEETKVMGVNDSIKSIKTIVNRNNAELQILAKDVGELEKNIVIQNHTSNYPIELQDAGAYDLKGIEIDGNSEQETRSGKNLLKNNGTTQTYGGITFTKNDDGTILVNGTYSTIQYYAVNSSLNLKPNTIYTMSGAESPSLRLRFREYDSNGTNISEYWDTGNGITITTKSNLSYVNVQLVIYASKTNVLIKPQIEQGSVATPYEPYGAMPSPDYPSEVKSVKGITNLFKIENTTTISGVTLSKNEDGTFNINGTASARTNFVLFLDYNSSGLIKNKTYTLWCNQTLPTGVKVLVEDFNDDTYIKDLLNSSLDNTHSSITYTINPTGNKVRYGIRVESGTTINIQNIGIQLEQGTTQNTYVPYGTWLIQKTRGKNLFTTNNQKEKVLIIDTGETTNNNFNTTDYLEIDNKYNTYTTSVKVDNSTIFQIVISQWNKNKTFIKRETYQDNKSGAYTFTLDVNTKYVRLSYRTDLTLHDIQLEKGTQTPYEEYKENTALIDMNKENLFDKDSTNIIQGYADNNTKKIVSNTSAKSIYLEVEPNTTYTISKIISTRFQVSIFDNVPNIGDTATNVIYTPTANNITITTGASTKYMLLWYYMSNDTLTEETIRNSITIFDGTNSTPYYELCSIGDIKDTFENGVLTKRIGKVVLNGSESWVLGPTSNNMRAFQIAFPNNAYGRITNQYVSDRFKQKSNAGWDEEGFITTSTTANSTYLFINTTRANTVAELKTWLSNNPVEVYYLLNESQTYNLDYTNLSLFQGYNHISLESDINPSNMEIDYLTDSTFNEQYVNQSQFTIKTDEISSEVSKSVSLSQSAIDGLSDKLDTNTYDNFYKEEYTKFVQDSNSFQFDFNNTYKGKINDTEASVLEMQDYIKFVDGDIVLGSINESEDTNDYRMKIEKDRIGIYYIPQTEQIVEATKPISSWKQRTFEVGQINITNGDENNESTFAFIPRANGSLSFRKVK